MEYKDLEITRKSTKLYEIFFKKDGMVKDITGWSIYFTVKRNVSDEDNVATISKTITDHADAINGKSIISLESADTDISAGVYWYSIDWKDSDANEGVLYYGKLKISEPIRKVRG